MKNNHGPELHVIYQKIVIRLLLGWLFLCITVGAGVLWSEIYRVEDIVHELALNESQSINEVSFAKNSAEQITQFAEKLVKQHFLMVELFNQNKQLTFEAVRGGLEITEQQINQYRHQFPQADKFSHELHLINGHLWLIILLPLKDETQTTPGGYFEGVYEVDAQTFASIKHDILRTLIFVTLGISFTSILMYPIVYALIRGVMKLSGALLQGNLELLNVLGCAIAERDSETNSHNYRVTFYALKLGKAINLADENLRHLLAGAFLHDVGKIGIRDPILLKPDKLNPEEYEVMKTHVSLGVEILKKSSWLYDARDVVEFHHEKYDGSGYLKGLQGEQIPINARIFSIVDVFDALTSKRPYKQAWSLNEAIATLANGSGKHFDPELVKIFTAIAPELYQEVCDLDANQLESLLNSIIGPYFLYNS